MGIVGKFLADRAINVGARKNTLASLWQPVKDMSIRDVRINLFLFQFFHELDIIRVIKGAPWTFYRHQLLTKVLGMDENRSMVPLYTAEMVQVYDLPTNLRLDKVIQYIVNFIEKALQPFFFNQESNPTLNHHNYKVIPISS